MNTIKKQAFLSTIFSYGGVVLGFVSQFFLIPHYLTEAQNGLLAVLLSYMYVLVQLASLGFNAAGGRFFSHFRNVANKHNGYLFLGILTSLIGFIIVISGLLLLKDWAISNVEKSTLFAQYFYFLIPITFATLFFNLFDNYAKNLYDTVTGTFLAQFLQRLLMLLSLTLLIFHLVDFEKYIYFWALAVSFYLIPMFFKIWRLPGFSLKPDFSVMTTDFRKQFLTYSSLSILTGFSSMVILYIDKIMLEKLSSLSDTGIYNTAAFFGSVMGMSLMALNKAAQPIIADSFARNDFENINTIYRKSCTTSLIVGCWIFLGIYLNLDSLFLLLPPSYSAGKWVIIIISLGKLFDLATGLNGTILALSNYYRYDTYLMISLILITILLNLWFIPLYGINGAALALAVATVYFNLVRYLIVWKKLGMQPFTFDLMKVIFLSFIAYLLVVFVPHIAGDKTLTFIDIAYHSILLSLIYGMLIYWSKISPELNGAIRGIFQGINQFIRPNLK